MSRRVGLGTKNWGEMTNEEKQQSELEMHGPLPEIGDWYIWGENLADPSYAAELCQVTRVTWNCDEWWVHSTGNRPHGSGRTEFFNDLGWWNEMTRKLSPEELSL